MSRLDDLTGKRFGNWTVICLAPKDKNGHTAWRCRCDCGNERDVLAVHLKRGKTTSCGCVRSPDLVGQRFGRLTVVSKAETTEYGALRWNCICDCGNETTVYGQFLKSGHTKSCGCLATESIAARSSTHGKSDSRLYNIWHGMKSRCYRKSDSQFKRYGQRGIEICDDWTNDFQSFYGWAIANGYRDGLTIDRIDNDGNYCPENCRWTTAKVQSNNKSNNHFITANGETHTISEWADILGCNDSTLSERLKDGWSEEDTISKQIKKYRRRKK